MLYLEGKNTINGQTALILQWRLNYSKYGSGDENHLCGANLRDSHKISLKVQRHGVGTPNYVSQ